MCHVQLPLERDGSLALMQDSLETLAIELGAFAQLGRFIEKARLAGVEVAVVGARNTSRACPECGHRERGEHLATVPLVRS